MKEREKKSKKVVNYVECTALAHSRVPSHHGPRQIVCMTKVGGGGGKRLGVSNSVTNLD